MNFEERIAECFQDVGYVDINICDDFEYTKAGAAHDKALAIYKEEIISKLDLSLVDYTKLDNFIEAISNILKVGIHYEGTDMVVGVKDGIGCAKVTVWQMAFIGCKSIEQFYNSIVKSKSSSIKIVGSDLEIKFEFNLYK